MKKDRQTQIVIPRAPVGAKKVYLSSSFRLKSSSSQIRRHPSYTVFLSWFLLSHWLTKINMCHLWRVPYQEPPVVNTPCTPHYVPAAHSEFWSSLVSPPVCIDLSYPVCWWRRRIMLEYKDQLWQFLIFTSGSEDSLSGLGHKQQVPYVTSEARAMGVNTRPQG